MLKECKPTNAYQGQRREILECLFMLLFMASAARTAFSAAAVGVIRIVALGPFASALLGGDDLIVGQRGRKNIRKSISRIYLS